SGAPTAGAVGSRTAQIGEHPEERVANPGPVAPEDRRLERELALHPEAPPASLDDADEVLRVQGRDRGERDQRLAVAGLDLLDTHGAGSHADADDVQELIGRSGQGAESVGQLRAQIGDLCLAGRASEAFVENESLIDLGYIFV